MTREVKLTLQSDMCGNTLTEVLELHDRHGLRHLDAKTGLHGEPVETMTVKSAELFAKRVADHGISTYAFSTSLFHVASVDADAIRVDADRLVALLPVLETIAPQYIRVLAPQGLAGPSEAFVNALTQCAEILRHTGAELLVENGPDESLISSPAAAAALATALRSRTDRINLIWDVQNMWQCGWFPRPDDLSAFPDGIRYVHVKGGRTKNGEPGGPLEWASTLAEASWPVAEFLDSLTDSPDIEAIALNPSHGKLRPDETLSTIRDADIKYLLNRLPLRRDVCRKGLQ